MSSKEKRTIENKYFANVEDFARRIKNINSNFKDGLFSSDTFAKEVAAAVDEFEKKQESILADVKEEWGLNLLKDESAEYLELTNEEFEKLSPREKLLSLGYKEELLEELVKQFPDMEPDDVFTTELSYA